MREKTKRHYVNNKDFYEAIVSYKAKLKENPNTRVPDYIGQCILAICTKLSTKPNFIGYSFRDEMIADAIENCIGSVDGFDPEKSSNPFAYFTQIAWNAFIRRIQKEKKQQYIKHKNMQNSMVMWNNEDHNYGDSGGMIHVKDNQISNDIIDSFEKKLTKSKKGGILGKNVVGVEKFTTEEESEDESKSPSTTSSN
jgi:DNA-directed RNA polymerase specialized sigma24 family protein